MTVKKSGHAVTVILPKDKTGERQLIQKDPLPKAEATARTQLFAIAKGLGIKTVAVIPAQENETSNECLFESYRFLAKMLDGKFVTGFDQSERKLYSVSEKKPVSVDFVHGWLDLYKYEML